MSVSSDIGHDNGIVKYDKLVINPNKPDSGSIVSGGAKQGGGDNVKINSLGVNGRIGGEFSLAEANVVMDDGTLIQPLEVNGVKFKNSVSGRETLVYRINGVRFDRRQMSSFARSIARQLDDHLSAGNFGLEGSMIQALGYYPGQEADYEKQMHALAENGKALDVRGRRMQGLFVQNLLHTCQAFVGQGLGLVKEDCTHARRPTAGHRLRCNGKPRPRWALSMWVLSMWARTTVSSH